MFRSILIGSNDIGRSKVFYDATMGVLGFPPAQLNHRGAIAYRRDGTALIITPPLDGKPATVANGGTIGLQLDSEEQVLAWHEAGVANGGTSIEDPPGIRTYPTQRLFSAYLRDPDGHKLLGTFPLPD